MFRGNETPRTQELVFLGLLLVQVSCEGRTSSSKKAPLKTLRVLDPTSPFVVPTTRKEAPTGNAPFIQRVKHYHQWLRTKFGQIPSDSVRVQGPSKRPSSGHLYPVSSVKERNRKGRKCKISQVLQSPVPSTQASPKVEASHRPKQAQHFSRRRKVQNGNSRVHQDLPDSRGMGIVDRLRFCYKSQVFQFTSLPFGLATAPQVFTMIVKEVKLMALSRGLRLHQHLDDWLIRSQSQEEAQVNTQAVVDLTQSLGWIIN